MERNGNDKLFCQAVGAVIEARWGLARETIDELLAQHTGSAVDALPDPSWIDMPRVVADRIRAWNAAVDARAARRDPPALESTVDLDSIKLALVKE